MILPAHEAWPLEEMPLKACGDVWGRIQTRRQWTDARLLFEAKRRAGGVVTFDEGMKNLAGQKLGGRVLVLRQRSAVAAARKAVRRRRIRL